MKKIHELDTNITQGKVYSYRPSLCMFFFAKFGEMLLMKGIFCYWFESSEVRGSCNIVNMSKNWQKIQLHAKS